MRLPKVILAVLLCLTMVTISCTQSQFMSVLNEIGPAITTILEIVAVFRGVPANLAPATKISADVVSVEKLYADFQTASAIAKPGIENDINTGFVVLNSDLQDVFKVAQVSNQLTQDKITALITLVETAVNIAESSIPSSAVKFHAKAPTHLDTNGLVSSFNHILVAKTGVPAVDAYTSKHKLHVHNKLVRVVTAGRMN